MSHAKKAVRSAVCLSNTKQTNTVIQISLKDQNGHFQCPWSQRIQGKIWPEHLHHNYDMDIKRTLVSILK
ncbi:MAG: hypothetical protein MK132_07525 [Lentisphaerales bacterium]|nr:hypothetical protein [Lentisphaerales bacterium]